MKFFKLLMFIIFLGLSSAAQDLRELRGTVKTPEGTVLSDATVLISKKGSRDSLKRLSNERGEFTFSALSPDIYMLQCSFVGYAFYEKELNLSDQNSKIATADIIMVPSGKMLENITLESQKIQIKEDTVSYLIDSTLYRKNDNVEEVLKKLPGIQVDKEGNVTAQGKQVTKVKVNGKEFFNGDVTTATRELNADMVDRIQIIDDYGDQSAFTGIRDGDPTKTLNIQLRKDKNKGNFGSLTAGSGTEGRYVASASFNRFNNEQQITLLTNVNNTNFNPFNFGSAGGTMGNMMASMARSMGVGTGGAGFASTIGNFALSDGISVSKSAGLNYRDEWGSKVSVYGSYSYNEKGTDLIKTTSQQNLFQNNTSLFVQQSDNNTLTANHRFSFNMEYRLDSANFIKFNPGVTYRKTNTIVKTAFNNSLKQGNPFSNGNMDDYTKSFSPALSGNLLFNHRFKKRGRTISFNLKGGWSQADSDEDYYNITQFFLPPANVLDSTLIQNIVQSNKNMNYGIRTSYTEPLSKKRFLEINHTYNYQLIGNDRRNYNINPVTNESSYVDSSSNIYDNIYQTNRWGVNYIAREKKYNYTVGLSVQPATIRTNSITGNSRNFNRIVNYFPVVKFSYNFSRSRSLNINYNGVTNQPSNAQLQPIVDKSNPQFITIGNPGLRPEFSNTFNLTYSNFSFVSGNVFFGNITASFTRDKIVNSIRLLKGGVQETQYLNSNGYYTVLGFYNVSKPFQNRKYVFNWGGNVVYNNNISFIRDFSDNAFRNTGKNWIIGQRISTEIKIKKWLETTVTVNYSLNSSRYSLQQQFNSNTVTWTLSNSGKLYLPQDLIFTYDIDQYFNSGFAGNVNSNPLIINSSLEKQIFKKRNGIIKLQSYDLLNNNIGISRSVTAVGFTDTRTNRLARYFMLSFIYKLNKFQADRDMMQMGMPGGRGGMNMMQGGPGF